MREKSTTNISDSTQLIVIKTHTLLMFATNKWENMKRNLDVSTNICTFAQNKNIVLWHWK